ncbi:AMP-binding protein [Salinicola aestuarinus]|uniref:AMP-binding protein n=1 Tax=Salinicola aestuarinus TaxID=1949082 RepID=UPI00130022E9|nr:AMP-binding protein [Salinicola aestuarinus]
MSFRELRARPWRDRSNETPLVWCPPHGDEPGREIALSAWHRRIGAWQALLERHDDGRGAWLLFEPDPVAFSAALIAIWERGEAVILPADNQPETVRRLAEHGAALGEIPGAPRAGADRDPQWTDRPLSEVAVTLFTSGSTGAPQRLVKTFAQLDAELATQAELWPQAGCRVISQVSHQHIYGLFFALMRPLCEDATLVADTCRYPETLNAWLDACARDTKPAVVISAPPALSRLPESLAWQPGARSLRHVYSSGAPLARADSDRARALLATPIHEVYGSSETGGIGWRIQQQGEAWTPLPGVHIECDEAQRLWLDSPHIATAGWQRQADRIQRLPDSNDFLLLGRADPVTKIGGKRLSLTAMDQAIVALDGIERAMSLPLQRRELRLAAVVALSPQRVPQHHAEHRALVRDLRRQLAAEFEPALLPRYWRFVSTWPTNAQGKLDAAIRQRLFADLDDRRAPRWLGEEAIADGFRVTLEVPERCQFLDGHFDGQPVLPGVALVHWAMALANRLFVDPMTFAGVERLRFTSPLLPGDRFTMTLTRRSGTPKLHLRCEGGRGEHASGRIALTGETHDT